MNLAQWETLKSEEHNGISAITTFCEYQIALVAVGKTRKRLKIVHFTTIIALVAVGKQEKEYRKIND